MPPKERKVEPGLKRRVIVEERPVWDFIQWTGDNETDLVDFVAAAMSTELTAYRSLDGTELLLVRNDERRIVFTIDYTATGAWVGVSTSSGVVDNVTVVPSSDNDLPSGFERIEVDAVELEPVERTLGE